MDTKALRQKILDLAIHGKLVPQDPNDEPASVLLERIKAEKERLIKEGKIKRSKKSAKTSDTPHYENVPFEVPEGWVWVTLKEITSTIGDGLHGTPQYNSEGDYFFINGNNLSNRKIVIKNETKRVSVSEYEKYKKPLNRSSILVSINGTIGNIGIYDGEKIMLGKSACYMNMVSPINIQYICIILESQYFLKYAIDSATGSTIKNVPLKAINNFKLPFPPISEQQRIVAEIEQWFALIDQIEQEKSDLQTIIKQTKSKILDLAIHGKLVPQDPNDEPAIELLKRIN
ncbi:restriction endonuclease subunit S, partial [Bacteroides heparinolyticus]|uniref:restriction endonuclease subunit S n=1 Tax=Prevotella heparinolytica TaxID=28113 RepID=UPI00359F42F9